MVTLFIILLTVGGAGDHTFEDSQMEFKNKADCEIIRQRLIKAAGNNPDKIFLISGCGDGKDIVQFNMYFAPEGAKPKPLPEQKNRI